MVGAALVLCAIILALNVTNAPKVSSPTLMSSLLLKADLFWLLWVVSQYSFLTPPQESLFYWLLPEKGVVGVRSEKGMRANGIKVVGFERCQDVWDTPSASLMDMPCHVAQRMACISQLHLKVLAVLRTAERS